MFLFKRASSVTNRPNSILCKKASHFFPTFSSFPRSPQLRPALSCGFYSQMALHINPQTSGKNRSYWLDSCEIPSFNPLRENLKADVCIVGAGIAGLSVAYECEKRGLSVVVLEKDEIASGESGRTTAHLSSELDDYYTEISSLFGWSGAVIAHESHKTAIDMIEETCSKENINCEFERVDGYLFLDKSTKPSFLDEEFKASSKAGLKVEKLDKVPSHNIGPCLVFRNQGQFHPVKYLTGLSLAMHKRGKVSIFTQSHVTSISGGKSCKVEIKEGHSVVSDHLVVATNVPIQNLLTVHAKQSPWRTYVICGKIPKGSVEHSLFWDTADPYHYVRVTDVPGQDYELLIIGGEDHKVGQMEENTDACFIRLEDWTRERWPMMQEVVYKWSGQIIEPVDYMGYVGVNPSDHKNVYICTGDSGNGVTNGTLAGRLIADLITKKQNSWAKMYDPSRITVSKITEVMSHNLNINAQYKDLFTGSDVKDIEEIPVCSGRVIRKGLKKYAVFKDEKGGLTVRSAICTHLDGVVRWNDTEKTWDCPVHGSRFTCTGHVINGPAMDDLKEEKDDKVLGS